LQQTALINSKIYRPGGIMEDMAVVIGNGMVQSIQPNPPEGSEVIDMNGWNISPGLVDIQINGGEELYFSESLSTAALDDLCDASKKYGATYVLPCLISSPRDKILEAIELIKNYQEKSRTVIGMHLEGPFIHPERRGAHHPDIIRKPTNEELKEILKYGKDAIRLMTIAPEQFTEEQLHMILDSGICLSIGHSTIGYDQAKKYFAKGITLVTHLFNAMTQFMHREPGLVGAALETESVYTPVILDGAHCHYASARIAYRLKQDKMLLLSDAAFLGRKKQSFDSSILDAKLVDGFYRNREGNLAGAAISMLEAVMNAEKHVGIPRDQALQMASTNVARALKMDDCLGKIEHGYPASFFCFKDDWSEYKTLEF